MIVRYHRRALAQIAEIIETLLPDPGVASAFARRIEALTTLISSHPMIGRPTSLAQVRVIPATPYPYLIFCGPLPVERGITVLRVMHFARDEDWRRGR